VNRAAQADYLVVELPEHREHLRSRIRPAVDDHVRRIVQQPDRSHAALAPTCFCTAR
jgi:hypothetical protein